jgi:hypothetical protein
MAQHSVAFGPRDADVMFREARETRRRSAIIAADAREHVATARLIRARRGEGRLPRDRDEAPDRAGAPVAEH